MEESDLFITTVLFVWGGAWLFERLVWGGTFSPFAVGNTVPSVCVDLPNYFQKNKNLLVVLPQCASESAHNQIQSELYNTVHTTLEEFENGGFTLKAH